MWLLQFAVVITFCHACGHLAQRVGQSRVIGEITVGILLGPTLAHRLPVAPNLLDRRFDG